MDLVGDSWRFSLRLSGWQYPEITSGSDASRSSASARLEHLESVFGATVSLVDGAGRADVFIRDRRGALLKLDGALIAAPQLASALDQMNRVVATFAVRGLIH